MAGVTELDREDKPRRNGAFTFSRGKVGLTGLIRKWSGDRWGLDGGPDLSVQQAEAEQGSRGK